ncbi:hypothetical protein MTR67_013393 [Solanum verrucosum]|uniref:Uncharacterized protein n=1 Tax=Solanum verrucosum TaxID=315347 RepID=A0AAF0QBF3_SOLVR|nr:hypothetical protein MTR67_013393 [Solanum verrucosum]
MADFLASFLTIAIGSTQKLSWTNISILNIHLLQSFCASLRSVP